MRKSRPTIDPKLELERLARRHGQLKSRVAFLDERVFLSRSEQLERLQLKKEKLWTKDAIEAIRREV